MLRQLVIELDSASANALTLKKLQDIYMVLHYQRVNLPFNFITFKAKLKGRIKKYQKKNDEKPKLMTITKTLTAVILYVKQQDSHCRTLYMNDFTVQHNETH